MEEDTDGGMRFSSLCFISDHVGFQGTIKTFPRDFVVTEIDERGQLVSKAIDESVYEISKTQSEPSHLVKKPKLNIQDVSLDHEGEEEATNLTGYSYGEESHQSGLHKEDSVNGVTSKCEKENVDLLSSLLDGKTHTLLEQFACDIKGMWNSKTELIEPSLELSLGRILDKSQRAVLHSAVRQKFPFLITIGKSSEIIVKPNPEYKELCHLVSEEEALGFFKYLDAKKENSKFTFKPDKNKDHRKAVHHFLNKKFGNLVETKSFSELNHSAGNANTAITVRFREKARSHGKRARLECERREAVYTGNFVNHHFLA